jgi:hypothetical protein
MTFYYFLACSFSIILFAWIILRVMKESKLPPNNDDNGGTSDDNNFPIIDLPPGSQLDDWLGDRVPDDFVTNPSKPVTH